MSSVLTGAACFRLEAQARLRHHAPHGPRRARFLLQLQCEGRGKLDARHPVTEIAIQKPSATFQPPQEHCTPTGRVNRSRSS